MKRLKQLEDENARLRKLVADLSGAAGTVHEVELDERSRCSLALSKRVN